MGYNKLAYIFLINNFILQINELNASIKMHLRYDIS